MDFNELAKSRYSVRSFSNKKISEKELAYILEAGRLAPSAKNLQPHKIYVVQSEEALEKIYKIYGCFQSKTVLVVCGDLEASWENPMSKWNSAEMDASICATHMMLAAASIGVGSTWVCNFEPKALKEALELPEKIKPFCLLPLGYADGSAASAPSVRHADRKPLSDTVAFI